MKSALPDHRHSRVDDTAKMDSSHLPLDISRKPGQIIRRVWRILYLAVHKFAEIDGLIWAGAFAFNAFFSLFPLIILFVAISSFFNSRRGAGTEIIGFVQTYIPISGAMQRNVFDTIAAVVNSRGQAGVIAFVLLLWVAIQCFTTLIIVTNRAWGATVHNWWRLPVKSLVLFGMTTVAIFLGISVTVIGTFTKERLIPLHDLQPWVSGLVGYIIPMLVVFLSLTLFYKLAPRRLTRFGEVLIGALCATVLLRGAESVFVIYLKDFATLNAIYGAFGGIMALLLWIYVSGCIFIFGACLCAAQAHLKHSTT